MAGLQACCPGGHVLTLELADFAVRVVVLAGSRRVLVFDTGTRPQDLAPLQPLLAGREVLVVYSHGDWDHVQGTAALARVQARAEIRAEIQAVIAHDACVPRFLDDAPRRLDQLRRESPGLYDDVILIPPDLTFSHAMTLDLGGLTVTLHHLPGHTADSLVAFVPEHGLLLAGDTAEIPLPCVDWEDASLEHWIAGLQRWRDDARVVRVLPSHGPAGGRESLDHTIRYLQALREGRPPLLPEAMPTFYQETHQANLERAARMRSRA